MAELAVGALLLCAMGSYLADTSRAKHAAQTHANTPRFSPYPRPPLRNRWSSLPIKRDIDKASAPEPVIKAELPEPAPVASPAVPTDDKSTEEEIVEPQPQVEPDVVPVVQPDRRRVDYTPVTDSNWVGTTD